MTDAAPQVGQSSPEPGAGAGRTDAIAEQAPPGLVVRNWYGPVVYGRSFGRGRRAYKRRLAFLAGVSMDEKRRATRAGGAQCYELRGDVVLGDGRTVAEHAQDRPVFRDLGATLRGATERQRRRTVARAQISQWDRDFQRQRPELGPTTPRYAGEFARVYGSRIEDLRRETGCALPIGQDALASIRTGKPDGWSGSGRKREELFDPGIFNEAIALRLHPNQLKMTGGVSIYAYCEAKAACDGKLWAGGPDIFAARLKEAVPAAYRKLGQRGEWEFERDCVPKLVRDRSRFACGEGASLDGRDSDQLVRVPASRGGWRPIRATEVVFFDVASGFPLGWHIAAHETADATLLAIRHTHDRCGLPRYVESDNGKGFVCAFGSGRRRKWAAADVRRLHALCEYLRIEVDHKTPRHAWKKSAESRFSAIKEIDRLSGHFIGGSPAERPEDVLRRVKKDTTELPTLDEFRRQRAADYELYADTPSPALGGLTRRQYFEAHRGAVRKVDPDFVAFACCRLIGGVKGRIVRRDGIEYGGMKYGRTSEEVHRLHGRRVWLRVDPTDVSAIWLCDQRGGPLCLAERSDLIGATPEHLREAHQRLARMRKAARLFVAEHAFFRGTKIEQVKSVLAEHRRAEAAEYARLHALAEPAVQLVVASEHTPLVKRARAAQRRAELRRTLQNEAISNPTQTGLDLLLTSARKPVEPGEEECLADKLVRFGHVG